MRGMIEIQNDGRVWRLLAETVKSTDREERIRVMGRNKAIILQSNRPYLRNRGLKYRRPTWKLVEGKGANMAVLEKIISALMKMLEPTDSKTKK